MTWIKVDDALPSHPKLRLLARKRDVWPGAALGWLVTFWAVVARVRPDGRLGDASADDIEMMAGWPHLDGRFAEALEAVGFLDRDADGLLVHDWTEYAGFRLREAARKRKWRAKNKSSVGSQGKGSDDKSKDSPAERDVHVPGTSADVPGTSADVHVTEERRGEEDGEAGLPPRRVVDLWNEVMGLEGRTRHSLTERRAEKLRARLKHTDRDERWWREYFARIRASDFCRGRNDRGWKADLTWAVRSEEVVAQVLEGKYDNRARGARKETHLDRVIALRERTGNL